jgi:hypothetical protein
MHFLTAMNQVEENGQFFHVYKQHRENALSIEDKLRGSRTD